MRAPGNAAADTAGNEPWSAGEGGLELYEVGGSAWPIDGVARGVTEADGEGEDDSTTHIRWDLVATNLATV